MLLDLLIPRVIAAGDLTIIDARGRPHRFGGAPLPGTASVTVRLHDASLHWRLAVNPRLVAGEAYMDGTLTVERGGIRDFLALTAQNLQIADQAAPRPHPFWRLARMAQQHNPVRRARANAAHHYDLSAELYRLFLDRDMQYSCAYFTDPAMGLDEAQEAKKRHIAAKLLLRPGQTVLDLGCGWGGLALSLARAADVRVLGITLSREQLAMARSRAAEAGLDGRVNFELADYRELKGRFDRIVSVGMFEHVGARHYHPYFAAIRRLLAEDGVALLHAIGRMDGPGVTSPWIRKYIFPGGYSPALSEVLPAVEDAGLWVTDVEILRGHYARTLLEWQQRFQAQRARIADLYDERFCRMWEFYLAGCEMAFRHQGHMVFQMQLALDPAAVPATRDYLTDRPGAKVAAE